MLLAQKLDECKPPINHKWNEMTLHSFTFKTSTFMLSRTHFSAGVQLRLQLQTTDRVWDWKGQVLIKVCNHNPERVRRGTEHAEDTFQPSGSPISGFTPRASCHGRLSAKTWSSNSTDTLLKLVTIKPQELAQCLAVVFTFYGGSLDLQQLKVSKSAAT